jgi:hypothetical protein
MTNEIATIGMEENDVFYVQVDDQMTGVIIPQSDGSLGIEKITREDFNRIASVVEKAGSSFVQSIRQMAGRPSECEIEFGISLGAEGGIPFFTKGSVAANFKVTIKWQVDS